jgi:hypothetical protein
MRPTLTHNTSSLSQTHVQTRRYCGDDGIDTDMGYQGRIQFAYVMVGKGGNHACEMDSRSLSNGYWDKQPRTFQRVYNALFVGHLQNDPNSVSSDTLQSSMMDLREGTAGEFGNIVMANVGSIGVTQSKCGAENRTQSLPPSSAAPDYLWFSPNNIINGPGVAFDLQVGCTGLSQALNVNPPLRIMPSTATFMDSVNPSSPQYLTDSTLYPSPVYSNVDTVPTDEFFVQVPYKGAFGSSDLWVQGWSWLDSPANGKSLLATEPLPSASSSDSSSSLSSAQVATIIVCVFLGAAVLAAVVFVLAFKRGIKYNQIESDKITMVSSLTKAAQFENPTYAQDGGNDAGYLDVERNVGTSADDEE